MLLTVVRFRVQFFRLWPRPIVGGFVQLRDLSDPRLRRSSGIVPLSYTALRVVWQSAACASDTLARQNEV
jgi:hypothetical protein